MTEFLSAEKLVKLTNVEMEALDRVGLNFIYAHDFRVENPTWRIELKNELTPLFFGAFLKQCSENDLERIDPALLNEKLKKMYDERSKNRCAECLKELGKVKYTTDNAVYCSYNCMKVSRKEDEILDEDRKKIKEGAYNFDIGFLYDLMDAKFELVQEFTEKELEHLKEIENYLEEIRK